MLCWIQSAFIVGTYLLVGLFCKFYAKVTQDWGKSGDLSEFMPWPARAFTPLAPWLLLVPAIWVGAAILFADTEGGIAEVTGKHIRIGYCVTVVLALICIVSILAGVLGALGLFQTLS